MYEVHTRTLHGTHNKEFKQRYTDAVCSALPVHARVRYSLASLLECCQVHVVVTNLRPLPRSLVCVLGGEARSITGRETWV
jgi:hypothetical protein